MTELEELVLMSYGSGRSDIKPAAATSPSGSHIEDSDDLAGPEPGAKMKATKRNRLQSL